VAYYRTAEGKEKKKLQNGKRGRRADARRPPTEREEMQFDADIVRYLAMVISLIEGCRVSKAEILRMLVRAVRQHSMARRRRREYVLSCWKGTLESP
jgi:hypothetical protein